MRANEVNGMHHLVDVGGQARRLEVAQKAESLSNRGCGLPIDPKRSLCAPKWSAHSWLQEVETRGICKEPLKEASMGAADLQQGGGKGGMSASLRSPRPV